MELMMKQQVGPLCRHCGKSIIFASYVGSGHWEPDVNPMDDPVVWRHVSDGYAICWGHGTKAEPRPTAAEYVYVASSWRNPTHTNFCEMLEAWEVPHYDFKNPPGGTGFSWKEVQPEYTGPRIGTEPLRAKGSDWIATDTYRHMLTHPRADQGFLSDFGAMQQADTFVLILPCGKSAHLELGWAAGAGKRTGILLEDPVEPELMYKMCDYMTDDPILMLRWIQGQS